MYDAAKVADRIPTEHVEARAELFVLAKRPERALDCLLDVQGTSIAPDAIQRLVADHGLFDEVARGTSSVCQAALVQRLSLFVSHVDVLPIDEMGEQLEGEDLAWYLQLCFEQQTLDAPELSKGGTISMSSSTRICLHSYGRRRCTIKKSSSEMYAARTVARRRLFTRMFVVRRAPSHCCET